MFELSKVIGIRRFEYVAKTQFLYVLGVMSFRVLQFIKKL